MKTGCGYIRVSTHGKQEELSPDAQKRLIKDYAAANNIIVDRFFVDSGISGKSADKRPAFKEMIATCKESDHPYDCVLLWKFSRFARNIDESTYYKSILRKKCNVEVISISEPIDDNMYGRLIEMIITWSDEFYSYNLSGEVKRGMTQHAIVGGYNGIVPLGYVKQKGNEHIPEIDPAYGPLVQKIFTDIANGKSPANISVELNDTGHRTRTGRKFESRIIIYIIHNPFYIGKIRFNNYDNQRYSNLKAEDKGQFVLVDGKHPPLVSNELFKKANTVLAARSVPHNPRSKPSVKHAHWLSGTLKCGYCGGPMGYSKERLNKYNKIVPAAFVCTNYSKGRCAKSSRVNAEQISAEVIKKLSAVLDTDEVYKTVEPAQHEEFDDSILIKSQLSSLDDKEKRIKDAYINGIDSIEEYRENKKLLQDAREVLEKRLLSCPSVCDSNKTIDMTETITDVISKLQSELSVSDKIEALNSICSKITWYKEEEKLKIELFS